jgi:hypothetical protein
MIIKGQARGRARQLAAHLLRTDENERIHLHECRGALAKDVEGALIEMEARGLGARTQRPLYHASISPEAGTPLKGDEITRAVDLLEERLGLHGQPRLIVTHRKKERDHVHVVWSRIDAETGTAVPYSWNYRLHERAARELETMFGHRPVPGSRDRTRPTRSAKDYEYRQSDRSGSGRAHVTAEITALWNASHSGRDFRQRLEKAGYVLARGDRRVFVVVDRAGEVHSLARRIHGADTAMLRSRLKGVDLAALPSVAEARPRARAGKPAVSVRFRLASGEVAGQALRLERQTMMRVAGQAFAAAARPQEGAQASEPVRLVRTHQNRAARAPYRAGRAIILADYAAKIAAARCHAPRDELEAILEALYAERDAALRAFTRTHQRRSGNRATVHVRPRRRRKPPRVRI